MKKVIGGLYDCQSNKYHEFLRLTELENAPDA